MDIQKLQSLIESRIEKLSEYVDNHSESEHENTIEKCENYESIIENLETIAECLTEILGLDFFKI